MSNHNNRMWTVELYLSAITVRTLKLKSDKNILKEVKHCQVQTYHATD